MTMNKFNYLWVLRASEACGVKTRGNNRIEQAASVMICGLFTPGVLRRSLDHFELVEEFAEVYATPADLLAESKNYMYRGLLLDGVDLKEAHEHAAVVLRRMQK